MSCQACRELGQRPRYERPLPSVVYYAPIAMPGPPTLEGHRLSAEQIAIRAWYFGVKDAMSNCRLSRAQVIVCCWWAGLWGPAGLQRELGTWAAEANRHLWYSCVRVGDPPLIDLGE